MEYLFKNGGTRLEMLSDKLTHIKYVPNGLTARCPAHDDRHNSLSVSMADDGRILLKCHAGCDTRNILTAVGLSFRDLFPSTGEKQVSLSSKKTSSARERVVYPYVDEDGQVLFEVVRVEPKGFFQRRPAEGGYVRGLGDVRRVLYRLDRVREALRADEPVLLCEGEKDAEALNALGFYATTAPMGAGKWRREYTQTLVGARVIICPDNDGAGLEHLRVCGTALRAAGCSVGVAEVTKLEPSLAGKKGADVSDYLDMAWDKSTAAARLLSEAVPFVAESDVAFQGVDRYLMGDFPREVERNRTLSPLSTGFPALDELLGRRMYAGLYVLGSVSSLGKTAFVNQIAMAVAAQGRRVLFFTLEMSRAEMTARCLARLLFERDAKHYEAIGVNEILYGDTDARAQRDMRELAILPALRNLCYEEGGQAFLVAEIASRAVAHKKAFGESPVIILDYLQILAAPGVGMGEKQAVDANILALKRLSRELDTPILVVSSFNRQNYAAGANLSAFKESGAIEYAADVAMALQARGIGGLSDVAATEPAREIDRLTDAVKRQETRQLELVVLKNRRGKGYGRLPLTFYARNCFFMQG